jgi:hypothetical protein
LLHCSATWKWKIKNKFFFWIEKYQHRHRFRTQHRYWHVHTVNNFYKNEIIQCNYMCLCLVFNICIWHWDTANPTETQKLWNWKMVLCLKWTYLVVVREWLWQK